MNKICRNVIVIEAKYEWNLYLFLQNFLTLKDPLGSHILKHMTRNIMVGKGRALLRKKSSTLNVELPTEIGFVWLLE